VTNWTDPRFDPPGWDPTPRPPSLGCVVAVLIGCVLWAAILVPLIIYC
jgi:hypothetical protein